MALVNIQEKWTGEEASGEMGPRGTSTVGTSRRIWTVLFDGEDASDSFAETARVATGIPRIGDESPWRDDQAVLTNRAVHIGPLLYDVTVEYGGENSPLLTPYIRSWESVHSVEAINLDITGDLIANAADDPITGVMKRFSDSVYVVTRNESHYNLTTAQLFRNSLNSHLFYNAAPGLVFMSDILGQRVTDNVEEYWKITYKMIFRTLLSFGEAWAIRVLNEGPQYLSGGVLTPVVNKKGVRTAKLAADGTLLASGADDVFLEFDIYELRNFNDLNLLENQSGGL